MKWVDTFKYYIITTECIDYKIIECILEKKAASNWASISNDCLCHSACFATVIQIITHSLTDKYNLQYPQITLVYPGGDPDMYTKIYKVANDIIQILNMDQINLIRLNKTINDTALNTCDIITQGRELTDHRAQLDLITEAVDSTTQDCIKNEQMHKAQFSELRGRIQILETTTPVEFKNIKTQLTKQQQILDDVVSVHLENYEQNENMVSSKLHKLQNSYSQLEDRVSKMAKTQQTEIKIMETGITNIRERLARMDEREEKLNSDIKEMKNSIIVLLFAVILILSCLIYKLYM